MQGIEILGAAQFEKRFGNLFRAIFCGLTARKQSFCDAGWEAVLLPNGIDLEQRDFDALASAVRQLGDDKLILSDVETLPPHQHARIVQCEHQAFGAARFGSCLAFVDTVLFSPSGGWGAICNPEYTLLAGDSPFVAEFLNKVGGREALRHRFLELVDSWENVDRVFEHGFGQRLLLEVGWV
jgi:hypothetical protein